jgi:hypothetical protein
MAQTKRIRSFASAVAAVTKFKGIPVPGPRAQVDNLVKHEKLTIEQYAELLKKCKPAPSQRQHEFRWAAGKAKYLLEFRGPQTVVAFAILNGEFHNVDSNTRGHAWTSNPAMTKPSHVHAIFFDAKDIPQLRSIYDCFDAKGPTKVVAHELLSYMRECGVDIEAQLISTLILSGKWKGALKALMKSSSNAALKEGVRYYLAELLAFDQFGLKEGSLRSTAVVGAALHLLKMGHSVKVVEAYVNEFRRLKSADLYGMQECIRTIEAEAWAAFTSSANRGSSTSSERAIPLMLPAYIQGFREYCLGLKLNGPSSLVKLAAASLKVAI